MTIDLKKMYQAKKDFAANVGKAYASSSRIGIESVDYDVFIKNGETYEFVIVNHRGGAKSIIETTGSSEEVIGQEIASVISSGRYDQKERYKELKEGSKPFDFTNQSLRR